VTNKSNFSLIGINQLMKKHMKMIFTVVLSILMATAAFAGDIKSGEELLGAMNKRYQGKWYKTLTFVQKTTNYKPDGTSESETWYEALTAPGKLRIDMEPLSKGSGIIFADGNLYSFQDGKLAVKRPFVHPLLVLGFDVYMQPVETTAAQIKGFGIDLSTVHEEKWQGEDVYVVGAKQGDLTTPQFWVTKKDLLFVRLIQLGGKDKKIVQETQFNKYVKVKGGGWVSAEVKFFSDGKPRTTEEYSNIKVGSNLTPDLYDPEKFTTVDRAYYK
jgi:outer membrane lipoprotein-sorting protein